MLQLWKARRGRKAAVARIAPFIEKSRIALGGIPDAAWQDAYLIGFLAMLASLEARERAGFLKSNALGLVQSETLAELSGQAADVLGEVIYASSMEQQASFEAGCSNAAVFHSALHRDEIAPTVVSLAHDGCSSGVNPELYELWKQLFEERISIVA